MFLPKKEIDYLMSFDNVIAVGSGNKTVQGVNTRKKSVICSVAKKVPEGLLSADQLIPRSINGLMTDIIEIGVIKTLALTDKHRPAFGGVSIGHKDITAGTLGCLVRREDKYYILSNNHVLANSNAGEIGDAILQPGPHDGGKVATDTITTLADFVPIEFTEGETSCDIASLIEWLLNLFGGLTKRSHRFRSYKIQASDNYVDAAIAGPVILDQDVIKNIADIGEITGKATANVDDKVQKTGRTTGWKQDVISQTDVTVNVQYGEGKIATFKDQLMAGPMSAGGDSGSAVLNMNNEIVGLLFAGSETVTIINNIDHVFTDLDVSL